jgi:hypothetical protein
VWRFVGRRLVAALVCCPVFVRCLFGSSWQIRFDSVHIQQSMTLASSTLQTRRHGYSEHFKFVIFVGFVTIVDSLPLYAINVDAVSLFTDSSFSVFSDLELYCSIYFINLNEWMNIVFSQKKSNNLRMIWLDKYNNCLSLKFVCYHCLIVFSQFEWMNEYRF